MMDDKNINSYINILKENRDYYEISQKLVDECNDSNKPEAYYYAIWAPVITEYVKWVLDRAVWCNVKRLYFLARDAYPMYVVATRLLGADSSEKVECRYLRVSRQAVRVPEYHLMGRDAVDMIFISGIDVTMRKICKRAQFTEDETFKAGRLLGIDDIDAVLNRREIGILREKARECEEYLEMVYEHSRHEYEVTIDYLRQEGFLDDLNYAVVDSGWVGTMQRSIERLVRSVKPEKDVSGYYFGLYEHPHDVDVNKYKCYYFAPTSGMIRKSRFANCIFEAIYSEDMPMTVGYEKIGSNLIIPIFSDVGVLNGQQHEENIGYLNSWLNGYLSRCGLYSVGHASDDNVNAVAEWVDKLLGNIMSSPDRWEAEYYGGYQFSDDLDDAGYRDIAPVMSQKDINSLRVIPKLVVMLGLSKRQLHESAWIEGSCVKSGYYRINAMRRSKLLTVARQQVRQICLKR